MRREKLIVFLLYRSAGRWCQLAGTCLSITSVILDQAVLSPLRSPVISLYITDLFIWSVLGD